ncbi:unnamed protein product [Orchesella dallaii]|uniref:SGTA homodimerisation domain-containing protein n=1 Tax=Orchesella dallaii TaxID=48710 RepID=A0ABP1QTK6_9HEXA
MEDQQNTKKVVYGVLEFLDEEFKKTTTTADSKESLEVAMQCLETAFGIGLRDTQFKPAKSLRELVRSQGAGVGGAEAAASASPFAGNLSNPLAGASYVNTGAEYAKPPDATDSDKQQADELKNKGNDSMKNLNFTEALDQYNKAILLDGNNAVYFCNRAAAYIKLEQYDKALRDCQIAVQLQPSYARAYGRMGVTYSSQNNHVDAILCYKKALELEPDNESYKKNLQISQHMMLQDVPAAQAQAAASPNLQSFFSNPNLINMASQMLQDPSMQQM